MEDEYRIIYMMGKTLDYEEYFRQKGYRDDIFIEIGQDLFEVYFFLYDTLEYEMMLDGYCSYPGLIIIDDITSEKIEIAVKGLYKFGFFDYLKPFDSTKGRFRDRIWINPKR